MSLLYGVESPDVVLVHKGYPPHVEVSRAGYVVTVVYRFVGVDEPARKPDEHDKPLYGWGYTLSS